ncbi:putative non-specific serine/threonine protein kinase [Helianthus anomalus]
MKANEGKSMDLTDANLAESSHPSQVLRSIQVGLLCVQQNAGDRPNMSSVIMMLDGERALPQPKQSTTRKMKLFNMFFRHKCVANLNLQRICNKNLMLEKAPWKTFCNAFTTQISTYLQWKYCFGNL